MKLAVLLSLLFLSILVTPATATTHTIMFGPGYYSPSSLNLEVGDTVTWQADDSSSFTLHPLESYDFPAGAAPIFVNTGTTYSYVVAVAGTYKYRCQLHWMTGMLGEFTAAGEDTSGARHVIVFGPGYYSPATLQVEVGDVIAWQADDSSSFELHPLESYDFPAGAAPIFVNTGTLYEYLVTVPGTYKYRCQLHWMNGMLGQFSTDDIPPDTSLNKHIIVFDSFFYSPALITDVVVGDTIEWRGDFVAHPLVSAIIPLGAASFSNSSGTVFQYVVTTEGVYTYACALHGLSHGMAGSFITVGAGVNDPGDGAILKTLQAYPNPVSTLVRIPFEAVTGGNLLLTFHDITGREVRRAVKPVATGRQEIEADLSALPSGMYTYRLTLGQTVVTGQVVVAR